MPFSTHIFDSDQQPAPRISYPLIFFTVISFFESVAKGNLAVPLSKAGGDAREGCFFRTQCFAWLQLCPWKGVGPSRTLECLHRHGAGDLQCLCDVTSAGTLLLLPWLTMVHLGLFSLLFQPQQNGRRHCELLAFSQSLLSL